MLMDNYSDYFYIKEEPYFYHELPDTIPDYFGQSDLYEDSTIMKDSENTSEVESDISTPCIKDSDDETIMEQPIKKRIYIKSNTSDRSLLLERKERRKQQNREAAVKSRAKKMERISQLEISYKNKYGSYPDFNQIIESSGLFVSEIQKSDEKRTYIKTKDVDDNIKEKKLLKRRMQNRIAATSYRLKRKYYIEYLNTVVN